MIHTVLVAHNNSEQTERRWLRDILPALKETGREYVATCVDNSAVRSELLWHHFRKDYLWQEGQNLMYGGSINLAVPRQESEFVLYACTRHGRSLDDSWLKDLLAPMVNNPKVAMTGHLMGSNSPEGVAHDAGCPWIKNTYRFVDGHGNGYVPQHVQGGVWAARTAALPDPPYPPEVPHLYTDHMITWALLKAGHEVADVPAVRSVWRDVWKDLRGVKYIHDEAHT